MTVVVTVKIHMHKPSLLIAALVLCGSLVQAQSLGDVASQNKEQHAKKAKAHKVVTNEDIPSHPEEDDATSNTAKDPDDQPKNDAAQGKKSAAQWKAEIQAQKDGIHQLQAQLEKLKSSIYFVEANRYVNGVEYNQSQLKKQQQAERMQKQLDGEKTKLENMQEAARREGYGSAVYDP